MTTTATPGATLKGHFALSFEGWSTKYEIQTIIISSANGSVASVDSRSDGINSVQPVLGFLLNITISALETEERLVGTNVTIYKKKYCKINVEVQQFRLL